MSANATSYKDAQINQNDQLGNVEIYNAKAQGLDSDYSVQAKMTDGSSVIINTATYDADSDRLILPSMFNLNMPQVEKVTFTKSA